MKNNNYRSTCAIAMSVDLFGDKWSLLILRDMLLHRKSTFKEFSNSKEKIASNIENNNKKDETNNKILEMIRMDLINNKINNSEDKFKQEKYKNDYNYDSNYNNKTVVFNGKANVSGVVSKDSFLPSGTYFFVLKYPNYCKQTQLKGFINIDNKN